MVGHQPPRSSLQNAQMVHPVQPSHGPAGNMQQHLSVHQHNIGHLSNIQEVHMDQSIVDLPANVLQNLRNVPPGFEAVSDMSYFALFPF